MSFEGTPMKQTNLFHQVYSKRIAQTLKKKNITNHNTQGKDESKISEALPPREVVKEFEYFPNFILISHH